MTVGGDIALVKAKRCCRLIGLAALNQASFAGSAQYAHYYMFCPFWVWKYQSWCLKKKVHVVHLSNYLQPLFNLKLSWKGQVQWWMDPFLVHAHPAPHPDHNHHHHHHRSSPYTKQQLVLPLRSAHPIGGATAPLINGLHTRTCSVLMQLINMFQLLLFCIVLYSPTGETRAQTCMCAYTHEQEK